MGGECTCFNPRTYIRYDFLPLHYPVYSLQFQSTYLYKVRRVTILRASSKFCFNPRTYIRYDTERVGCSYYLLGFNPRTYIRYDVSAKVLAYAAHCFNPRTYIRYDGIPVSRVDSNWQFQSTYLYKVRREPSALQDRCIRVSIHVPI